MHQAASQSGKSLTDYIQKFLSSNDGDFVQQGHIMQETFFRWESFSQALAALQSSSVLLKPVVFLTHLNMEVFKSTLAEFTFGLPLNVEGTIYALLGMAVGFLVFFTCRKLSVGFCRLIKNLFWKTTADSQSKPE
jgi:hypothetical protein